MNSDIFAEWFDRQGYQVVRTESSYWVKVGLRIFQSFPYHHLVKPTDDELNQLLLKHKHIGLRYSAPFSRPEGAVSYHVVYDMPEYTIDILPQKARYDVRKGLRDFVVKEIKLSTLAKEGWNLRKKTLERQGRKKAETKQWWQRLCFAAEGLQGFEAWGTFLHKTLAASLLAFTCDNCCSILYQQSKTEYLRNGVNNLLTFVFTSEVLKRRTIDYIFYGLHSLDAPPSVDDFKFRMMYKSKPVKQHVVFNPWLKPLFNKTTHSVIKGLKQLRPGSPTFSKADGMLEFYLEGKRQLHEQHWPTPLEKHKVELLNLLA